MEYFTATQQEELSRLLTLIDNRRKDTTIYPTTTSVLRALELTPLASVKVVMVGQDPYHQPGQADGLAFSSASIPKSLQNIFKELQSDVGCRLPSTGRLDHWAKQGVLLLNRILTVEEGKPLSHQELGWLAITESIIQTVSQTKSFVVFVLWGAYAQEVRPLIDSRHLIITAPHPSPLSAYRGFFGHKPFSKINHALQSHGMDSIDFCLL